MQVQSEDLSRSLGIETGQYMIKQLQNTAQNSQPRPKKRYKVSHTCKESLVLPENCSVNTEATGNWTTGSSVVQTSSFDELFDTQKMIEFALAAANSKDIDDLEPAQMMVQSDYLEGPVIKIAEFPGSAAEISGGNSSTTEDEMLFCYMAQSSQSASDLTANSDNTEQDLSLRQSVMITSAPVTQSPTLSFPLTLAVDGSALDNCPSLQFA